MSKFTVLMVLAYLLSLAYAKPTPGEIEAEGDAKVSPEDLLPKVFKYENGTVGVSFLGFKASAGLGSFITGNLLHGWPHAEFETPFGQRGGSGLGPAIDKSGKHTGFGYGFLDNAMLRVAPVAHQSSLATGHDITHSSAGNHKGYKGNHVHHITGKPVYGDGDKEVDTPTVKELEELKNIGVRKSPENEIGVSGQLTQDNKKI